VTATGFWKCKLGRNSGLGLVLTPRRYQTIVNR
jgi:hypothetical protein